VRENRGANVQLGPIGHEGFVGLSVFLSDTKALGRATVQVPGAATRMTAEAFTMLSTDPGPFRRLILRYTQTVLLQIAELTHCNSVHNVEQRVARTLLITSDRANSDRFQLSIANLASTIRSTRPEAAHAVRGLEEAELIRAHDHLIQICDKSGLEVKSCECYRAIRWELERRMLRPY
jgi:CRP-like cAMP-binding protein